jgi:chaperonin GroES
MYLKPLGSSIVVQDIEKDAGESKTAGGLFIPESVQSHAKQLMSTVISVGAGRVLDDGTKEVIDIKVGDVVVFSKFAGQEIVVEKVKYKVVPVADILCVVVGE